MSSSETDFRFGWVDGVLLGVVAAWAVLALGLAWWGPIG